MYGSEVLFSGEDISDFGMVNLSFFKNMLGAKNSHLLLSMGIQEGILFFKTTNTSIEILDLPKSCYLRIMYHSLASLDFIGKINWCSHIRLLLFRTNHHDVWRNHGEEKANLLIKQVKLSLINTIKVDWLNNDRKSLKLRTYIQFKIDYSLEHAEEYLCVIPDTRWIMALLRLRMSSHTLEIERERHVKPQEIPLHAKQYRFFKKNRPVQTLCNPRRTLQGFSWGCIVIVLKGSF